MFRAAILFSLVLISFAKLRYEPDLDEGFDDEDDYLSMDLPESVLWTLKVESGMELKPASPDEEEEFEENTGHVIDDYIRTAQLGGSARPPIIANASIAVGMDDILGLLNKFALYTNEEPDTYLSESEDGETSLVLFFKTPLVTSLVVNVGNNQWHYIIKPRSPFPAWFYKDHTLAMGKIPDSVQIPEEVKQRFYVSLWRLLRTMLNYPL